MLGKQNRNKSLEQIKHLPFWVNIILFIQHDLSDQNND